MKLAAGLDIGGTKIAGAVYDGTGHELAQLSVPTPQTYEGFLQTCQSVVVHLEQKCGAVATLGVCAPYADAYVNANLPFLIGQDLGTDLKRVFGRDVPLHNDANCAALAEALDGAGRGHRSVIGLIMGTGIGGGFIYDGRIVEGANGLCGEIGHLPLPYYEPSDGSITQCGCGQRGCIETLINGKALARLHYQLHDEDLTAKHIGTMAAKGHKSALATLDRYYTTVAKAMVTVIHGFDPEIIVINGGLNTLPGMCDAVQQRWGRYALAKKPRTKLVPAALGPMAGLHGAALLGRETA